MKYILSHRRFFYGIFALICIVLLLLSPKAASRAAAAAAQSWLTVILPTLLPFSVLAGILVKTADPLARRCAPISRLFGFSDRFAFVFLLSLLSGYPVGAKMTAALVREKRLSAEEGARFLNAASTSGPGFLVSGVALGMLGDTRCVFPILTAHILSAAIVARLNGTAPQAAVFAPPCEKSLGTIFLEALSDGVSGMLTVLGAMVLFSALAAFLRIGGILGTVVTGVLEFSAGCIAASALPRSAALPLISFFCGFGSCSVLLQTAAIAAEAGIPLRGFFGSKLLQGALAALIAVCFCPAKTSFLLCGAAVLLAGALFSASRHRFSPSAH